jgi:hypothetical protein
MGDAVHAARGAHRRRQRERELGVVDDGARQHAGILAGEFALALAHAPDRGRFRSGIGGRHREDRQAEVARDDLGKPDGGAAAGGDEAIGAARRRDSLLRHRLGDVERGLRMQPRRAAAQNFDQPAAEAGAAAGRGDHQRAVETEPRGFVRDAHDRARREHHALRRQVMNERDHAAHVRRDYSGPRIRARGELARAAQAYRRL